MVFRHLGCENSLSVLGDSGLGSRSESLGVVDYAKLLHFESLRGLCGWLR